MRVIKLKVDLYTKVVLTIIAVALIGILVKPLAFPMIVDKVDIARIGGTETLGTGRMKFGVMPVTGSVSVDGSVWIDGGSVEVDNIPLPVTQW